MMYIRFMKATWRIAIVGGGAAGFFAALSASKHHPHAEVVLFEKSSKLLSKVKISGGGRCNVTHACFAASALAKNYPRGGKFLKKAFENFQAQDTVDWFEKRGVPLKAEADGRMFPRSDSSQSIIDCLLLEAQKAGIAIRLNASIQKVLMASSGFELNGERFDRVIVATGGSPKSSGFDWLRDIGHKIIEPVPSLFTFNIPKNTIIQLMGVVVPNAIVKVQKSKLASQGPVLVTHWGLSGPGVLKLSAWGARDLAQMEYTFNIQVNWLGRQNEIEIAEELEEHIRREGKKKITNACPFDLPKKFWLYILEEAGIGADSIGIELSKKSKNRLINQLLNQEFAVRGKTTFKEEFVTCGGIDLSQVNVKSMESTVVPGLYFAGEILDIDGITGGFNFQAAWTTGFIAGQLS